MDVGAWCKITYTEKIFCHLPRPGGIYVVDENWNNLVILDACRFDSFKAVNTIEGKLESRISRGSSTVEFLSENFIRHPNRSYFDDIVYVAGNPLVSSLLKAKFHKIYPVWDYGWDDEIDTVHPGQVAREASNARKDHPDKRLIIHFMQPHFPSLTGKFGGETGISGVRRIVKMDLDPVDTSQRDGPLDVLVSALLQRGDLSKEDVIFAYKENLRTVISYVSAILDDLPGTTIVTSDHGEVFGDRSGVLYPFRVFGHPQGLPINQLVVVPWLIVAKGSRASSLS